jgi:hypothetical protein
LEELEERAKHAGFVEGTKRLGEQLVGRIEGAGERVVGERAGRRLAERVGERAAERLEERAGERWGDWVASKWGKRVADSTGQQLAKAGERAGERLAERTGERLSESFASKLEERVVDSTVERLMERGGKETAERVATSHLGESLAAKLGKRVAEPTGERWIERAGERTGKRIVERTGERMTESMSSKAVASASERLLLERAGERQVASAVAHSVTSARAASRALMLRRLGRGVLIAVPVLGGMFALYLWRQDATRAIAEWKAEKVRRAQLQSSSNYSWLLFALASCADAVDAVCHFGIGYMIFRGALGHELSHLLESLSVTCAVVSTACAVGGESVRRRKVARSSPSG